MKRLCLGGLKVPIERHQITPSYEKERVPKIELFVFVICGKGRFLADRFIHGRDL